MHEKNNVPLKMYILIREDIDLGYAILGAAHASLSGYLTFTGISKKFSLNEKVALVDERTQKWVEKSFRKVVCKVNAEEFEKAKTFGVAGEDYRVMVESSLGGEEVSIVFAPRNDWEPFFKTLKLYK